MKMTFGKYKGQDIEDVPTGYLIWALENVDKLTTAVVIEMENQLKLREREGIMRNTK